MTEELNRNSLGNFKGFFPSKKVPKNILGRQWPRLPHNLNLYQL
jgi:hypothetical protein